MLMYMTQTNTPESSRLGREVSSRTASLIVIDIWAGVKNKLSSFEPPDIICKDD